MDTKSIDFWKKLESEAIDLYANSDDRRSLQRVVGTAVALSNKYGLKFGVASDAGSTIMLTARGSRYALMLQSAGNVLKTEVKLLNESSL